MLLFETVFRNRDNVGGQCDVSKNIVELWHQIILQMVLSKPDIIEWTHENII